MQRAGVPGYSGSPGHATGLMCVRGQPGGQLAPRRSSSGASETWRLFSAADQMTPGGSSSFSFLNVARQTQLRWIYWDGFTGSTGFTFTHRPSCATLASPFPLFYLRPPTLATPSLDQVLLTRPAANRSLLCRLCVHRAEPSRRPPTR